MSHRKHSTAGAIPRKGVPAGGRMCNSPDRPKGRASPTNVGTGNIVITLPRKLQSATSGSLSFPLAFLFPLNTHQAHAVFCVLPIPSSVTTVFLGGLCVRLCVRLCMWWAVGCGLWAVGWGLYMTRRSNCKAAEIVQSRARRAARKKDQKVGAREQVVESEAGFFAESEASRH